MSVVKNIKALQMVPLWQPDVKWRYSGRFHSFLWQPVETSGYFDYLGMYGRLWCRFGPVLPDLIVELHADVTVARIKGQSVYLYLATCNLSLTGLTKPLASACFVTQAHWKCESWINPCIHKDIHLQQSVYGTLKAHACLKWDHYSDVLGKEGQICLCF